MCKLTVVIQIFVIQRFHVRIEHLLPVHHSPFNEIGNVLVMVLHKPFTEEPKNGGCYANNNKRYQGETKQRRLGTMDVLRIDLILLKFVEFHLNKEKGMRIMLYIFGRESILSMIDL